MGWAFGPMASQPGSDTPRPTARRIDERDAAIVMLVDARVVAATSFATDGECIIAAYRVPNHDSLRRVTYRTTSVDESSPRLGTDGAACAGEC